MPNPPVIGGVTISWFHLKGQPSPEGVQITKVRRQDGAPMRLEIANGPRLRGVDPSSGDVIAERTALTGTTIGVLVKNLPYEIVIERVAPAKQVLWPRAQLTSEVYDFWYRPLSSDRKYPLCSKGRDDPSLIPAVVSAETDGWTKIVCAASSSDLATGQPQP